MTLLFDGKNAFFAERDRISVKSLVIHLPRNASLFVNGICYFPTGEAVHLPATAIRTGENVLALRIDNRIYPTEGLYVDTDYASPMGLLTEPLLLRQCERIASLEEKLSHMSERVARLEKRTEARMLFS